MADATVDGQMCCHCGIFFEEPHGYPVLCKDCYNSETEEERCGIQRAWLPEMEEGYRKKKKGEKIK